MKNKRGFTLVELLAVIAILAILVIIALPNVMGMFNDAKKNSFTTELKQIYKVATQTYISDSMFDQTEQVYARCNLGKCEKELDLSGRTQLEYYIKIDKGGKVIEYYATDGTYQYSYKGNGLLVTDISNVDSISDLSSSDKIEISCSSVNYGEDEELTEIAIFDRGSVVNKKMKLLSGVDTTGTDESEVYKLYDTNIRAIKKSNSAPSSENMTSEHIVSSSESYYPIYMWYDNGTIYYYSEYQRPYLNPNSNSMFLRLQNLSDISGLSNFNASRVETLNSTFREIDSIRDLSAISGWKTTKLTSLTATFYESCITSVYPLRNWNTSKVTTMNHTFRVSNGKACLQNISGLENWDVSNVTDMSYLFNQNHLVTDISPLRNWNTSKVTNMSTMFQNVLMTSLEPIRNWDVSNVKNLSWLFGGSRKKAFTSLEPLKNWNTSNVNYMNGTFCSLSVTNLAGLENWDTSKVITMGGMFQNSGSLVDINAIKNWNVSNVDNYGYSENDNSSSPLGMFSKCSSLSDSSAINNWNIKRSAKFDKMFYQTPSHPLFTKVNGTWDSEGTFIPN